MPAPDETGTVAGWAEGECEVVATLLPGPALASAAVAAWDAGELNGLYCLRPDRMQVVAGKDGWPAAYAYTTHGRTVQLSQQAAPMPRVPSYGTG